MVTLKDLSNAWRTLQMPLFNCEINLILTWFANCVISNATVNQGTTFEITDTKLYVPVVTLSTDDNGKLLQQFKSGFKSTIKLEKISIKNNNTGSKLIFKKFN